MNLRRRLLASIALVATLLTVLAPSSAAQDEPDPTTPQIAPPVEEVGRVDSWAVAPAGSEDPDQAGNRPNLSYDLDPGATVQDGITIYNYGNVPLVFRVYPTDAINNADGSFELLPGDEDPRDVGRWITIEQENVQIPPGEQITMPIAIKVPADATAGDHVGAILASNAAEGVDDSGAAVTLDRRTGTRVYIRVAGDLHPELAIENVKTTYEHALNPLAGTAHVTYRVQNRGNVRLAGAYELSISGPFGVARKRVPAKDLEELLPGQGVTIEAEFDGVPATFLAFTEVRVEPSGATAGGEEVAAASRTTVTLMPPITVIILLLALWLLLRARTAARRHRRAGAGARPSPERVLEPQGS